MMVIAWMAQRNTIWIHVVSMGMVRILECLGMSELFQRKVGLVAAQSKIGSLFPDGLYLTYWSHTWRYDMLDVCVSSFVDMWKVFQR